MANAGLAGAHKPLSSTNMIYWAVIFQPQKHWDVTFYILTRPGQTLPHTCLQSLCSQVYLQKQKQIKLGQEKQMRDQIWQWKVKYVRDILFQRAKLNSRLIHKPRVKGDNKKQEQGKKFVSQSVSQYVLQFDFTRHFYWGFSIRIFAKKVIYELYWTLSEENGKSKMFWKPQK